MLCQRKEEGERRNGVGEGEGKRKTDEKDTTLIILRFRVIEITQGEGLEGRDGRGRARAHKAHPDHIPQSPSTHQPVLHHIPA